MSKYIFIGIKKDLFGCFRIEEIRDKDNATGLKERGGIEMSTTVLSIYAMHALFRFLYFTYLAIHRQRLQFYQQVRIEKLVFVHGF